MNSIFLLVIVVVAVVAILAVVKAKSQSGVGDDVWPYYAKKPLSQPEQVLYFRLVQALPDHIVLAQVQLSRLLGVKKGNNYQAWFNRINRMSADFVVCKKDSSIVAVIELDDATHQKEDRQAADAKKDKALSSADIRVVRWQVKSIPDITAIQAAFMPSNVRMLMGERTAAEAIAANVLSWASTLGAVYTSSGKGAGYKHWAHYHELFGTKPSRIDLLNAVAPSFFRTVQDSLFEAVLLHLARLTDPAQSTGSRTCRCAASLNSQRMEAPAHAWPS